MGRIKISESRCWVKAGWCYTLVLEAIIQVLSETNVHPGLLEYLRSDGPQQLDWVDLRVRSAEEVRAFRQAAAEAVARARKLGGYKLVRAEVFPNFAATFDELVDEIDSAASENRATK
jgi:hypothetical protein